MLSFISHFGVGKDVCSTWEFFSVMHPLQVHAIQWRCMDVGHEMPFKNDLTLKTENAED
jgi:hypothetical protein